MLTKAQSKFSKLYFPGLISLVFLPMLCIGFLLNDGWFQKYYSMEFIAQSRPNLKPHADSSPKIDLKNNRKYSDLTFTGDQYHDQILNKYLKASVKQLNIRNDTVNGIRVSFSNHSKYSEFVNVVDLCHQPENDNIVCMYYEGEFFIWHLSTHWHFVDNVTPPTVLYDYEVAVKPVVPFSLKVFFMKIYIFLVDFWPSVLAFIAMLWFAFSKKKYYLFRMQS